MNVGKVRIGDLGGWRSERQIPTFLKPPTRWIEAIGKAARKSKYD